jgi:putative endonuclease
MRYFVYILYSSQLNQYYTGHSADLDDRLNHHVNSGSKSTKKASDWKIVYTEEFITKSFSYVLQAYREFGYVVLSQIIPRFP